MWHVYWCDMSTDETCLVSTNETCLLMRHVYWWDMSIDVTCWLVLVVLDHRANSSSATGRFELVYRATTNPNTKGCDTRFVVEGQRINKVDLQRYVAIDRKLMRQQEHAASRDKSADNVTAGCRQCNKISLVQSSDSSEWHSAPVDCECNVDSSQEPPPRTTHTVSASQSHERATSNSHKTYRGLRPSTVQIYNGR